MAEQRKDPDSVREVASIAVEIAGIAAIVTAGWLFSFLVGLALLGAGLIYVAQGI